ncbi:MAG: hypothetical protein LBI38_05605 [Oscillospiraceae bacterium]|nr:hypothetical protein [Oscillospiraceae bacterium]
MKIEMGESLFYSWLRHVKECQVVQTNWKPSPSWSLLQEENLDNFMHISDEFFERKYALSVYKKNSLLTQLIKQAEIDALGISMFDCGTKLYAVDVAYHESGLSYGDRKETVARIAKKYLRTAMCMRGYFEIGEGEIVFASPKIHTSVLNDLKPIITDLNVLFSENKFGFTARLIANDDFNELIMKPIMIASDGVSDISELFLRAYQLVKMFSDENLSAKTIRNNVKTPVSETESEPLRDTGTSMGALSELKIGKIAQTLLCEILESGKVGDDELAQMCTKDYSKETFGLDFPLLILVNEERNSVRYYSKPLNIKGKKYYMCSQWFEVHANNDRPFLLKWLDGKL